MTILARASRRAVAASTAASSRLRISGAPSLSLTCGPPSTTAPLIAPSRSAIAVTSLTRSTASPVRRKSARRSCVSPSRSSATLTTETPRSAAADAALAASALFVARHVSADMAICSSSIVAKPASRRVWIEWDRLNRFVALTETSWRGSANPRRSSATGAGSGQS